MNRNIEFILSPITNILENVVSASSGVNNGIETFPLCDYIMQSMFLKMTGFQEQKMKILCWEMATNDYQYRYEYSKSILGECSTHKEKQSILRELIKQILLMRSDFIIDEIDKESILNNTRIKIAEVYQNTNLASWAQSRFYDYLEIWSKIKIKHFLTNEDTLLTSVNNDISLLTIYENNLYKHRNRCAHNTLSYQQNLPTLKTLVSSDFKFENYFLYSAILVLIDEIIISLFEVYLKGREASTQ